MMYLDEVLKNGRRNLIVIYLENVDEFYMNIANGILQETIYNQLLMLKEENEEIAYLLLHAENADELFGFALPNSINPCDDEIVEIVDLFYKIVQAMILRFNKENFIEELEHE